MAGFTDRAQSAATPGAPVLGTDAELATLIRAQRIDGGVVGVGNTALARRAQLYDVLRVAGVPQPALVHPRAAASPSADVGAGSVVFAGSVLGSGVRIGVNAVLYSGVVVEHECAIGDHAYLSPGVVLSGQVTVEQGAFLGAGAVVLPGLRIGAGAVVAAGAVVTADVSSGQTVMGVPARAALLRRKPDEVRVGESSSTSVAQVVPGGRDGREQVGQVEAEGRARRRESPRRQAGARRRARAAQPGSRGRSHHQREAPDVGPRLRAEQWDAGQIARPAKVDPAREQDQERGAPPPPPARRARDRDHVHDGVAGTSSTSATA